MSRVRQLVLCRYSFSSGQRLLPHAPYPGRSYIFNDTSSTELYTLSLHDALPISASVGGGQPLTLRRGPISFTLGRLLNVDRKSTRLNSSHTVSSYAVFCLKKKRMVQLLAHPIFLRSTPQRAHHPGPGL